MNIESLGPETVDAYFERGLIHDVADLYQLKVQDLWGEDGTKARSANKIIEGIEESKKVPFERVLFALGIRFVGKVVAKGIARHFKSMEALFKANIDDLLACDGVGEVIASSVRTFLRKERNITLIKRLSEAGVQMCIEEKEMASTLLAGMTIVISGTFEQHSREEYKKIIEDNGGKNATSISKKTSFILAGEGMGPSKREKAEKLGIPIINETEFLAKLEV